MSNAQVTFCRLGESGEAGPGTEQVVWFKCPKRKNLDCGPLVLAGKTNLKRDPNGQNGGIAQWDWNGDRAAPTLTPSVNCHGCWHGYIEGGRCVSTSKQEEPEPA